MNMGLEIEDGQLSFAGLFLCLELTMKHPNSRYGNPLEMAFYRRGLSDEELAHYLHRSTKTIERWRTGREKIPFWVPELLRLREFEYQQRMHQMGIVKEKSRLGLMKDNVLTFRLNDHAPAWQAPVQQRPTFHNRLDQPSFALERSIDQQPDNHRDKPLSVFPLRRLPYQRSIPIFG